MNGLVERPRPGYCRYAIPKGYDLDQPVGPADDDVQLLVSSKIETC